MSSDRSRGEAFAEPHGAGTYRGAAAVFLGPEGLRAGWASVLFLVFLTLLAFVAALVTGALLHGHGTKRGFAITPAQTIVSEALSAATVLLATWLMARLEGRRFLSYGLFDHSAAIRFIAGLGCGFAAISALVGLLWSQGLLTLTGAHLGVLRSLEYALLWGAAFTCVAVFEESLLRGYLLFTLRRGMGFWPAAVLLSAAFGFMHHANPGESPVGLFAAAAVGLFFCLTIWYTGSLWWGIGFHAAWDWGESFFWSTSDSGMQVQGHLFHEAPRGALLWSGGTTGPEGSLWVLPVLALCAVFAWLWWRRGSSALSARGVHLSVSGE